MGLLAWCFAVGCTSRSTPAPEKGGVVHILSASQFTPSGRLEPGSAAQGSDAQAVRRKILGLLSRLPQRLRPQSLAVHLEVRGETRPLATHLPSRSLLVRGSALQLPDGPWLHELGHIALGLDTAPPGLGGNLQAALAEGTCDYLAGRQTGSAVLSSAPHGPTRDLRRPPSMGDRDWLQLSWVTPDFDPHHLGWRFAAGLWRSQVDPLALFECDFGGLAEASGVEPGLRRWLRSCPAEAQGELSNALSNTFPPQLWTGGPQP